MVKKLLTFVIVSIFLLCLGLPFLYPTVCCKFRGQLGNQLFEAAATIAYAKDNNLHPIFRSSSLKKSLRDKKNIHYIFHNLQFDDLIAKLSYKLGPKKKYLEKKNRYFEKIPIKKGVVLEGFFQSEKYFAHHRKLLLETFPPPKDIKKKIEEDYGHFFRENKVIAVHVRTFIKDRQDEAKIPQKWDYYSKALDTFPSDHFVMVFSDYPEYVKKRFPKSDKRLLFIEENPYYYDFWLMTHCDHFVVAPDSTFSWWAAWLNSNPVKRVLCEGNSEAAPDYYPDSWKVVPH